MITLEGSDSRKDRKARDTGHPDRTDRLVESGSRPISRVLSWAAIHLGSPSPRTSSDLPGSSAGHAIGSLFGLAPGGVYPATAVTSGAVRSYRTISPLPASRRYIFCCTFRRLAPPRRYLAPYPLEPGLSSLSQLDESCWFRAIAWPTPGCASYSRASRFSSS